jgi:hypothetical protein
MKFKDQVSKVIFEHTADNPYNDDNFRDPSYDKPSYDEQKKKLKRTPFALNARKNKICKLSLPMTQYEIEKAMGYARGGAFSILRVLEKEGRLQHVGMYWVRPSKKAIEQVEQRKERPAIERMLEGIGDRTVRRKQIKQILGYASDGSAHNLIRAALDFGYLERIDGDYFVTEAGRARIGLNLTEPEVTELASPTVPQQVTVPRVIEKKSDNLASSLEKLMKDYAWEGGLEGVRLEALKKFLEWIKADADHDDPAL